MPLKLEKITDFICGKTYELETEYGIDRFYYSSNDIENGIKNLEEIQRKQKELNSLCYFVNKDFYLDISFKYFNIGHSEKITVTVKSQPHVITIISLNMNCFINNNVVELKKIRNPKMQKRNLKVFVHGLGFIQVEINDSDGNEHNGYIYTHYDVPYKINKIKLDLNETFEIKERVNNCLLVINDKVNYKTVYDMLSKEIEKQKDEIYFSAFMHYDIANY